MSNHEEIMQGMIMTWARWNEAKYPALKWLYHTPNGGLRDKATASKLKRMGAKPGIPDLLLHMPSGEHRGLAIELKYGANKPTKDQDAWLMHLSKQGYFVNVCYTYDDAIKIIEDYVKGADSDA